MRVLIHQLCYISGDMLQSVFGHRHIVSCVDVSPEEGSHALAGGGLISTGSHDATVMLWRWSGRLNRVVGSLAQSQSKLSPISPGTVGVASSFHLFACKVH